MDEMAAQKTAHHPYPRRQPSLQEAGSPRLAVKTVQRSYSPPPNRKELEQTRFLLFLFVFLFFFYFSSTDVGAGSFNA